MQQVKIFKSIESELVALEEEINEWLSTSGAKVINITGNIAAPIRHWFGIKNIK